MKFHTTPYHHNLLNDNERLSVFYEAIRDFYFKNIKNHDFNEENLENSFEILDKTVFDIGCGSGVLSYFASLYFKNIIAIDNDEKIIDCAEKSFKNQKFHKFNNKDNNIKFINEDVFNYKFNEKADLIICEMLDTALIDEEEIPILNLLHSYLKDKGEIIPKGIFNIVEPVYMERNGIHYEDKFNKSQYKILGDFVKYSEFEFSKAINEKFKSDISLEISKNSIINGIKITTFTKLNDNIVCGPTPMLNPSLFIPIEEKIAKKGEIIDISLEYIMGGGLETIKTKVLK